MNYIQFSNKQNLIDKILIRLGILTTDNVVIKINNNPDYDITEYRRNVVANYFFNNFWDFSSKYKSIVDINILDNHIFHFDTLQSLSKEYEIEYNEGNDCDFLLQVLIQNKDAFELNSFGTEVNDFELHNLRIRTIDNLKGRIYYEGSFQGDSSDIEPLDWGVYSTLGLNAIPNDIDNLPFYKSLLAESYLLLKEKKFKLSYFLTFSAFESFVNFELGGNDEPDRLKDKFKELFGSKFIVLNSHQIYTSIMSMYDNYTSNRNTIAHGRNEIIIDQEMVKSSLLFILTLISTYELNSLTFDDLYSNFDN
ncbi:MAG: hypothetical protein PHQ74_01720 [Crocinitomicaceae bacterium]|nr:hypothetical protein [Crocinitomicaceae bacterium]